MEERTPSASAWRIEEKEGILCSTNEIVGNGAGKSMAYRDGLCLYGACF